MYQVSCLCNTVTFQIDSKLSYQSLCHCSICRKTSGSACAAYGSFDASAIQWKTGQGELNQYPVNDEISKMFCRVCGSTVLTHHKQEPELLHVSLGNVENDQSLKLQYHQYVDSKPPWFEITDKLPQFSECPDS